LTHVDSGEISYEHNNLQLFVEWIFELYPNPPSKQMMVTKNPDLSNCEANGTMCAFEGVNYPNLEMIVADDYWARGVSMRQLKSVKLHVLDSFLHDDDEIKHLHAPKNAVKIAHFPVPLYDKVDKILPAFGEDSNLNNFCLYIINGRTGPFIDDLVVSLWNYSIWPIGLMWLFPESKQ
jgi:hypothetical protein